MPERQLQKIMQRTLRRYINAYADAAFIINTIGDALIDRLSFIKITPKRILDLGSSLGHLSVALTERFPDSELIAIDICHAMNQQTQRLTSVITADAYHLPLAANSMDLIVANLLLPALLDYPALWQEIMRVLTPGGLLMFSNIGPDTLRELKHSFAAYSDFPHINTFIDLHHVGDSLMEAAFLDPVLDVDYFTLSYAALPALVHELKAMGSIKFVTDNQFHYLSKNTWHKIESYYRQHYIDNKQRLLVTVEAYFGHAFKPLVKAQQLNIDGSVDIPLHFIKRPRSL